MSKGHCITTAKIGDVFVRLEVVGYGGRDKHGRLLRVCRCECGKEIETPPGYLMNGDTKSCGCLATDQLAKRNAGRVKKHPNGLPKGYWTWQAMRNRCGSKSSKDYPRYGGRGIKVCERWQKSFECFIADMGEKPDGATIDRIDNDGDYTPENCRWATATTQANNRRNSVYLTHDGTTLTLSQWARRVGIKVVTLNQRLSHGWSIADALTTPLQHHRNWHGPKDGALPTSTGVS